jgi:beta-glucosidase
LLDAQAPTEHPTASTSAHRALATEISAQASVLLQNRPVGDRRPRGHGGGSKKRMSPVLPLSRRDKKLAVIGYDAGPGTQIEEGGSPAVKPGGPVISPLEGIRARAPRRTKIDFAPGTRGVVSLPIVRASVLSPASGSGQGLSGTYYTGTAPTFTGAPVATRVDSTVNFDSSTDATGIQALEPIPGTTAGSGRWTGFLTPPATGEYRFSLTFAGNAKLFIGDEQVIAGDTEFVQGAGAGFPGAPDVTFQGIVDLTAGQRVPIRVEYATNASIGGAVLKLGWQPPEPALRAEAVKAAHKADVAVVFVNDVTSEGMDRSELSLPGDQNQLIEAVAAANPRTVVVLHTASAVLMPWRDKVAAIVEAWYPGQRSGDAIAQTLYGDVDPSGRLPVTFPASESQGPTAGHPERYPGVDNVAQYSEGIFVGYRYYDQNGQQPLFPFGYGLSYTTFSLSGLNVAARGGGRYDATVQVRNTGGRPGAQVVQLYVGFPAAAGEPPRPLKAFDKVFLRPGQTKMVTLQLDPSSFQVFDEASNTSKTVTGTYRIYVGSSSRDLPLTSTIDVR